MDSESITWPSDCETSKTTSNWVMQDTVNSKSQKFTGPKTNCEGCALTMVSEQLNSTPAESLSACQISY